jgi:TM2 domain-containing membrane protein YozV
VADSKIVTESRRGAVVPAVILAWLLPGAGHLYLRRTTKGLVLLITILGLFSMGVFWQARLAPYLGLDDLLAFLRSIAQMAMGLPYFVARSLGFEAGLVTAPSHEYGNTFTEVSGLLNILVILDAYDTAVGRKD